MTTKTTAHVPACVKAAWRAPFTADGPDIRDADWQLVAWDNHCYYDGPRFLAGHPSGDEALLPWHETAIVIFDAVGSVDALAALLNGLWAVDAEPEDEDVSCYIMLPGGDWMDVSTGDQYDLAAEELRRRGLESAPVWNGHPDDPGSYQDATRRVYAA